MSSKSQAYSSGEVHKKPAEQRNSSRESSHCDNQQSEMKLNQRKSDNRSPDSRGYPKECIGQ